MRGLIASDSMEPHDIERILRAGQGLGLDLMIRPSSTSSELVETIRGARGIEFMLSDMLPDAEPGDPRDPSASHEREVLDLISDLRWVQLTSVGVDQESSSVTWREASNVTVCTASGLASIAMAQYIVGAILFHTHRLWKLGEYRALRDWSVRNAFQPEILVGRTLGLLGYGGTARRAAHIARSLGMRVIAVRRSPLRGSANVYRVPEVEAMDAGPEPCEVWGMDQLDRLLADSDVVACAMPLTPDTRRLLGARELGLLKRGAIVINVARGPIIDERALIVALQEGRLGGASLDVFEVEPLPADSPLWDLPNVMLTPHAAGTHDRVSEYTADLFIANLDRFMTGRPLMNVADRERGY